MRPYVKVLRDLWVARGRTAFMVLALAAGLTSMGMVLVGRSVLRREMTRSYMESVPASATFDVGPEGVDDVTLAAVGARPEVAAVARRSTRPGRWRRPGTSGWSRALLFAMERFGDDAPLAKLRPQTGATVPGPGEVLVERSALVVLANSGVPLGLGDDLELTTARGAPITVRIVGVVHEPALAPAASEQAAYLYMSPETLVQLGEPPALEELRVLFAHDALDPARVEAQAVALAGWLGERGVPVHEVRVPPPGQHPHQAPSDVVLLVFAIFTALTLVLASILAAALLSVTMARQTREIAVMKTLGATSSQIRGAYRVMLGIIALLSLALAAVPTRLMARQLISAVSQLLNFDIASWSAPHEVYALQVAVGLALPFLAAAPAIRRASRTSVLAASQDHGAQANPKVPRWASGLQDRVMQAALRNLLRVPRRLVLTVTLLGVGGALFISAASLASAWDAMCAVVLQTRHYDLELRLSRPLPPEALTDVTSHAEAWGFAPVSVAGPAGMPLSRTYPDEGHGTFTLVGMPTDTTLVDFRLVQGRLLRAGEDHGVVLNQLAAARLDHPALGTKVTLWVEGQATEWQVVGQVEEVAAPALAYVTLPAYTRAAGAAPKALRVQLGPAAGPEAAARLEATVASKGARVAAALPIQLLFNAMGEHVLVLVRALLALAALMAVVSAMALGSTMTTSVIERTRELAVLRAVGAHPGQVRRMVRLEGLAMAALSLPVSLLLALPLAAGLGQVIGRLAFAIPLSLTPNWAAVGAWTGAVLAVAALASWAPARAATRGAVSRALAHV